MGKDLFFLRFLTFWVDKMFLTEDQKKDFHLIRYLAEQAVSEPVYSLAPLNGGWISSSYEINGHIIFKIPGPRTPVDNWKKASLCAPVMQQHLSYQIPQPQLKTVFLNSTSEEGILSSFYEKIPGHIIDSNEFTKQDPKFKKSFFEQLSVATQELQAIPTERLPCSLIKSEDFFKQFLKMQISYAPDNWQKRTQNLFARLLTKLKAKNHPVICHSDLRANNICLDDRDRLVGILDFDSLQQGIPAIEFHPRLYWNKKDIRLFYNTFQQQTGQKIPKEDINDIKKIYMGLYALRFVLKKTLQMASKWQQMKQYVSR